MRPELQAGCRLDESVLDSLRREATTLENVRSSADVGLNYIRTGPQVFSRLKYAINRQELAGLVYSDVYWRLFGGPVDTPEARDLASAELDWTIETLNSWVAALRSEIHAWTGAGVLIVPDTNMVLHQIDAPLRDVHWRELADLRSMEAATVVFVDVVVDELDVQKRNTTKRNDGTLVKTQARHALREIQAIFGHRDTGRAEFIPATTSASAAGVGMAEKIDIAVVLDDTPTAPQRRGDAEIIDWCLRLEGRASSDVRLLTGDHGMALRARRRGVTCLLHDGEH